MLCGDPLLMKLSCVWRLAVLDALSVVQLCSVLVKNMLESIPLDDRSIYCSIIFVKGIPIFICTSFSSDWID